METHEYWKRYKKSQWWIHRRDQFLASRPKKCSVCNSGDRVGVYHKHYDSLNREKDTDLYLMCQLCFLESTNKKKSSALDKEYKKIVAPENN